MLEILNNEEFNDPNIELPKQPMKKGSKRLLIFGFAFLIAMYAIISSISSMVNIFKDSFANVSVYIGYLNEPYSIEEVVPSAITNDDYDMFVIKANGAGFDVFDGGGKIDLSDRVIGLDNNLTLTGNELGALIKADISGQDIDTFELMQLQVYKKPAEPIIIEGEEGEEDIVIENPIETSIVKMKTVFKISFELITNNADEVPSFLKPVVSSLPNEIYITTEYDVVEGLDGKYIEYRNGTQKINALTSEKNDDVIGLLIAVFDGMQGFETYTNNKDEYVMNENTFLNTFIRIVTNTIEVITDRTGGTFDFVVSGENVNTMFIPKQLEE